jgi:hypothetical protein
MLPLRHIERQLERTPAGLRDIVFEIRNIVVSVAPDAVEMARPYGFTYYHDGRGGPVRAGICQVVLRRDHVLLGFIHGSFLPDPRGLLGGRSRYRRTTRLDSFEEAPWDDLKKLIEASARFDPHTLRMK